MLVYPNINPVAFSIGSFQIYWYGLMYLVGFTACYLVLNWRLQREPWRGFMTNTQLSDMLFYTTLGVIIGGRLGFMIFYFWDDVIHHPLQILMVRQGGMSFHGGMIGVIVANWLYGRKINKSLPELADFFLPALPLGLAAGRIGNFLNAELWGRVTDVPWGMVFPNGGDLPRHPSQIYEFLLEGVALFLILWFFSKKPRPTYAVSSLFLIFYGLFRILIEFYREPDNYAGYYFGWMTKGQLLSIPMILLGIVLLTYAYRKKTLCEPT